MPPAEKGEHPLVPSAQLLEVRAAFLLEAYQRREQEAFRQTVANHQYRLEAAVVRLIALATGPILQEEFLVLLGPRPFVQALVHVRQLSACHRAKYSSKSLDFEACGP